MKRHLVRSAKYLVWLLILFTVIFLIMSLTGTSRFDSLDALRQLFGSNRGALMICALLVLALLYPRFGFVIRKFNADPTQNREAILEAFTRSGYSLESETPDGLIFRVSSPLRRVMLLWEDRIRMVPTPGGFTLEGLRKEVVKVELRLGPLLS